MTDEEKLRRILARVNELNAHADTIADPTERRHILLEGTKQIHRELEPVLSRYLAEIKRAEPQSIASDSGAIESLLVLTTQALKAARHVFLALIDKAAKPTR
jgi:hypothetical protein